MKIDKKRKKQFSDYMPDTFDSPDKLPTNPDEAKEWQGANREFWNSNPMRYDWNQNIAPEEEPREFFSEIDRRFFGSIKKVMPWKKIPFDNLIPFDELHDMSVLEIGVGMGSHASLMAPRALSYTGIDLTEYAVKMTSERMELSQTQAKILRMDAEDMQFQDNSFDLVWSWGVIHHSSNTKKILKEIRRVLKPGGSAVIMVYYRGWWNYYIQGGLFLGIFCGGFLRHKTLARVVQTNTDGALARYYSHKTWLVLVGQLLSVKSVSISGQKADLFPMPAGRIKDIVMGLFPNGLVMVLLEKFRMGSFLISTLVKK